MVFESEKISKVLVIREAVMNQREVVDPIRSQGYNQPRPAKAAHPLGISFPIRFIP